jgi:hypothetical protein
VIYRAALHAKVGCELKKANEMKGSSQNPSQDNFNFLCCPECIYKSKDNEAFSKHIETHPKSNIFRKLKESLPEKQPNFKKKP